MSTGAATLYINGEPVDFVDQALWPHSSRHVEIDFRQLGGRHFRGLVDEVRLYEGALSAERIDGAATYRPHADWLHEYDETMRRIVQGRTLSRREAEFLVGIGAPDTGALIETLETSEHAGERLEVVWTLPYIEEYASVAALIATIDSENEELAEAAAEGLASLRNRGLFPALLGERADAETVSLLGEVLRHAPDIRLQLAAIDGLKETANHASLEMLSEAVEMGNWRVRLRASRALEAMGEQGAIEFGFVSPYDEVPWKAYSQIKFDGHVHARGGSSGEDMVRAYTRLGYGAIAFADGSLRLALEDFLEDPDKYDLTVLPGQGNRHYSREEPYGQHTKVWFSWVDYNWRELDFEEALAQVGEDRGLAIFAHPASGGYPMYSVHVDVDWYIQFFDKYPHVVGLEINNHDKAGSLKLFDELLEHYGAERPVFGFGVSDTQGLRADGSIGGAGGFGLSLLLAPEREPHALRESIEQGRVFWIDAPEPDARTEAIEHPRIDSIEIEADQVSLDVSGEYESIKWIYANETIREGDTFALHDLAGNEVPGRANYVRFEITDGKGTTLGSQAFYVVERR